jgi:phosphopantetheinyl transferase
MIARWLRRLPASRATTLASRLTRGKGLESLTALALLAGLASTCALPPLSRLAWTPAGRPYFHKGPAFSLTHSKGFAACGVAPSGLEIGVDMEPVNRVRPETARLVADDVERQALEAGTLTPTEFWTAKEAVLKAAGAGLADIAGVVVRGWGARFGGIDYRWRHVRPGPGLLLAVASCGSIPEVRVDWPGSAAVFG